MPPIEGIDKHGIFVYRTIEDLETIALHARGARKVAVIGGGLLGLEAAKAIQDLGLPVVMVEFADSLMCRQLDPAGGRILLGLIEAMGVELRLCASTRRVLGNGSINGLEFADGALLDVDMLVVSAGLQTSDAQFTGSDLSTKPKLMGAMSPISACCLPKMPMYATLWSKIRWAAFTNACSRNSSGRCFCLWPVIVDLSRPGAAAGATCSADHWCARCRAGGVVRHRPDLLLQQR